MATLTLQVENPSLMKQLKSDTTPNAITLAAMKEAESGNDAGAVCTDNLDSFIKSMED